MATKQEDKNQKNTAVGIDERHELDSLIELLEGDITAIDPETASEQIDEWSNLLKKADEPEVKEISNSLKQLKKLLSKSKAKASDFAEVLSQLGNQLDDLATNGAEGNKTRLHHLARALRKNGHAVERQEAE